jgi:hypothetical protein
MVLCGTGLPSRSALVAPPLRLAALRWRVANVIPRSVSATSGRLDGLRGGCDALLRYAIPEGAPLENVPLPVRRDTGTFSRTARPPVREFSCPGVHEKGRIGDVGRSGPMGAVPGDRRSLPGPARRATFSAAPGSATRVAGNQRQRQRQYQRQQAAPGTGTATESGHGIRPRSPVTVSGTDRGVAGHLVLRPTGLPSRSALIAPPLRLAALRWRAAFFVLVRSRPPPGGSTAFLVAVARFSDTRFPRVPPLRMCPYQLGGTPAHSQGRHTRRCANSRAQRGP